VAPRVVQIYKSPRLHPSHSKATKAASPLQMLLLLQLYLSPVLVGV
jgi:hypothetical protein